MAKTITKPKPKITPTDEDMQAYVAGRTGKDTETQIGVKHENRKPVEMARLTVDLAKTDHRRFKIACTIVGVKMNDEIRQFIERRTRELESGVGVSSGRGGIGSNPNWIKKPKP